jgi:predicted methyltransferase
MSLFFMMTPFLPTESHRTFCITFAVLFVLSLVSTSLIAAEQNVSPGINNYYYDAEFEHWVGVFERPGREVYDRRHDIITALQLKPGMTVADIGAGTGFYTHLFAKQVGLTGKVYAVDISENFIQNILRAAKAQGLNNVEGIVNNQQTTNLPPGSVDLAFVCDTYHHFEYPQTMLTSISQALRPSGQLIIIDFRKQHGVSSGWVMSHVRANETAVISEVESAGFRLTEKSQLLDENFFLKFIKSD